MADKLSDRRRLPFAMVEQVVLRNPNITPQSKATYALLITYGPDRIFPGHDRLAADLGVTDRSIRRWLNELKGKGLVTWSRTGRSNAYTILGPDRTSMSDQSGQERPIRSDIDVLRSRSIYPDHDDDDDDGRPAATSSPLDLKGDQFTAYCCLRCDRIDMDSDAAIVYAQSHDLETIRNWCVVADARVGPGPGDVHNPAGFVRSKLDNRAARPRVGTRQVQEFMKWVDDYRLHRLPKETR